MEALQTSYVNVGMLYGASCAAPGNDGIGFSDLTTSQFIGTAQPNTAARKKSKYEECEDGSSLCPSISYDKRLIGILAACGVGYLLAIFSWVAAFTDTAGTFAVIYVFANVFMLGSTLFLCGPLKQVKNLLRLERMIPIILYFIAMILSFVFGCGVRIAWVTIITIIVQLLAMTFYAITYIPFASSGIRACLPCCK